MTFKKSKILHIDDDKGFLENTKRMFEVRGIDINGVTSGKEAVQTLKDHFYDYDLVIIDLAMPDMDGIRVYEEIREINPKIPIFFASAHFGELNWERKLREIEIEDDIKRIEKPFPLIISKDFKKIEDMIEIERSKYIEELLAPFKYSLDELRKLSDEDMDKVFKNASEVNFPFVKIFFEQNPDIDWVIIAKHPGNIVDSGKKSNEPFEEDLIKVSEKYNSPVFTYSRPKSIEQICPWSPKPSKSNPNDYYPTVSFEFESAKPLICDFDSGSTFSYISYEELKSNNLIRHGRMLPQSASSIWGKIYYYYKYKLNCKLKGRLGEAVVKLECDAVKKWEDSPLVENFKNRVGLIGRNLLLDNKLKLLLDSEHKETDIIE